MKDGQTLVMEWTVTVVYEDDDKGGGIGGAIAPPRFQICELRGLASHCVTLGTLACNTTQI